MAGRNWRKLRSVRLIVAMVFRYAVHVFRDWTRWCRSRAARRVCSHWRVLIEQEAIGDFQNKSVLIFRDDYVDNAFLILYFRSNRRVHMRGKFAVTHKFFLRFSVRVCERL